MDKLDPQKLFTQIAEDVPSELHQHLFVTGSLAAAYYYRTELMGQAINTKDADLVIHPAGHVESCREMTEKLLGTGWRKTDACFPMERQEPVDDLRAIRLLPPTSDEYFIEFLNIPEQDQMEAKKWIPIQMSDGWYGLPSFRFLGVVSIGRLRSEMGLEYAAPSMMALTNLLSHPEVGTSRIESGSMTGTLRSAKDLGRVIALARLAGRDEVESWQEPWFDAVKQCFPSGWKELTVKIGSGLEELLGDANALQEAQRTTDIGILNGMNVTVDELRAEGERLIVDLIEPLREMANDGIE